MWDFVGCNFVVNSNNQKQDKPYDDVFEENVSINIYFIKYNDEEENIPDGIMKIIHLGTGEGWRIYWPKWWPIRKSLLPVINLFHVNVNR